jgi:hypothetical protein
MQTTQKGTGVRIYSPRLHFPRSSSVLLSPSLLLSLVILLFCLPASHINESSIGIKLLTLSTYFDLFQPSHILQCAGRFAFRFGVLRVADTTHRPLCSKRRPNTFSLISINIPKLIPPGCSINNSSNNSTTRVSRTHTSRSSSTLPWSPNSMPRCKLPLPQLNNNNNTMAALL